MKIKRSNAIWSFVIVGILLILFGFYQIVQAETEAINNFKADIIIQKNGSVIVTENIVYNFGTNQKHGIFRDIPLTVANGPRLNINVSEVHNEAGQPYQYTTSITNNVLRIKIGDPNKLVTGIKTYIISYQVDNAIRTFSDHDELYWNVTGNQWPVTIQSASASVTLPDSSIPNIKMDCFTGLQGDTQKNCSFNQRSSSSEVSYSTTQPLNINEGLTIVLGIPLGYIDNTYVSPQQSYSIDSDLSFNLLLFVLSNLFVIFCLIAAASFFARRIRIIKPKPVIPRELRRQPIIVEYNPPDNLPPIEIGTLLDRRVDITDISSVILDLAVRGYIKIRYTVQKIRFWPDKKDFELVKLKDGADLVHPADKIIFELLFENRDSVKLSDLKKQKTTFQLSIKKIQEKTEQYLCNEGYFDQAARDKSEKIKTYLPGAIVILFIAIFIFDILSNKFGILITLLIGNVVAIVLSIMKLDLTNKLTSQGISTLRKILGFREFLQLTEKDKLQLLNAPELQPEMFERFLPYAMVLGVEDKWAQKFEGIYNMVPNWYEDPTATSFNSYVLAQNLVLFNSSFNRVFDITSTGLSSGFGGGGFSGGGSGGGGGGSW